jgi:DNA-binding NarL/FixJ family response regulator
MKKKVLIVDDHPFMRRGLSLSINEDESFCVCGEASDVPGGLAAINEHHPDVVIVDISLAEGSGLDLIKDIYALYPDLPVLALSMHHENLYAERALRAGAKGYVMKNQPAAVFLAALHKILNGQVAVSDAIVSQLLGRRLRGHQEDGSLPVELLSDRELDVYRSLGSGLGTSAIARKLHIAVSTVETYRASIKQKLNLQNSTDLIASAAKFVDSESHGA